MRSLRFERNNIFCCNGIECDYIFFYLINLSDLFSIFFNRCYITFMSFFFRCCSFFSRKNSVYFSRNFFVRTLVLQHFISIIVPIETYTSSVCLRLNVNRAIFVQSSFLTSFFIISFGEICVVSLVSMNTIEFSIV